VALLLFPGAMGPLLLILLVQMKLSAGKREQQKFS
jgi:hypothetical protein